MSEAADEKVYPGNLTRWRENFAQAQEPNDLDEETKAVVAAIDRGFEGLALVLTQIRFDLKGGRA
jgi:hypothetical protein